MDAFSKSMFHQASIRKMQKARKEKTGFRSSKIKITNLKRRFTLNNLNQKEPESKISEIKNLISQLPKASFFQDVSKALARFWNGTCRVK